MEQSCGLLADEVDAATVVNVVDVVPGDAFCPVLFLRVEIQRLVKTDNANESHVGVTATVLMDYF